MYILKRKYIAFVDKKGKRKYLLREPLAEDDIGRKTFNFLLVPLPDYCVLLWAGIWLMMDLILEIVMMTRQSI